MPWREPRVMDEKVSFVSDCLRGGVSMAAVCAAYGISRTTGYKWLGRYRNEGPGGLRERSRAPHRQAGAMEPKMAAAIVALRRERPTWGPKKLRAKLMEREPEKGWPAAGTMGDLLRREGLVKSRGRRHRLAAPSLDLLEPEAPNDVWGIDFKGWFRTGDGTRCDR